MIKILDITLRLFDLWRSQHIPDWLCHYKVSSFFRNDQIRTPYLIFTYFHIFRWFFSEYFNVTILPLSYAYI